MFGICRRLLEKKEACTTTQFCNVDRSLRPILKLGLRFVVICPPHGLDGGYKRGGGDAGGLLGFIVSTSSAS